MHGQQTLFQLKLFPTKPWLWNGCYLPVAEKFRLQINRFCLNSSATFYTLCLRCIPAPYTTQETQENKVVRIVWDLCFISLANKMCILLTMGEVEKALTEVLLFLPLFWLRWKSIDSLSKMQLLRMHNKKNRRVNRKNTRTEILCVAPAPASCTFYQFFH